MTVNGGGFAAGSSGFAVNIGGSGAALTWGSDILGVLKFNCPTSANVVTLQNAVNLNGVSRTIFVDDNPNSNSDSAAISGVISNGTGTAGIVKTGPGILALTGSNTYNGVTTISGGTLQAAILANGGAPSSIGDSANAAANLSIGGTFQYTGPAVATDRGFTLASDSTLNTANALTFSGQIKIASGATVSLTKMGGGTISLGNSTTSLGLYNLTVQQGALNFTAGTYSVGGLTYIGNSSGSGNVNLSGNAQLTSNGTVNIGSGSNISGYLSVSGGTVNMYGGGMFYLGNGGNAVVDQSGGTVNVGTYVSIAGEGGSGFAVYNMTGGAANFCNQNHWTTNLAPSGGTGILNVTGTAHLSLALSNFTIGAYSSSARGIVNLGAVGSSSDTSVLSTINIYATNAGTGTVNFHGGTLQALANTGDGSHTWPSGQNAGLLVNTTNYVYGEGAKINTNGYNVTIPQLLAPTGSGITSIPLTSGGSGYTGAAVQISGGGGSGATAVATFNPSTDVVTGITITNPGMGYTRSPTITLVGGGGSALP